MVTTSTKKTFTLAEPFQHGGETITEVALRRPKGREVRKMQNATGGFGDISFEMMAQLSERDEALFDEMDGADVIKIEAWIKGILGE